MTATELPSCSVADLEVLELKSGDERVLQRFFEDNPEYFLLVYGEPAPPNEAHQAIHAGLPAGWSYTKQWLLGYAKRDGSLAAMASVVSDLLAPSVWHIGLFIVETGLHGRGTAQILYRELEAWTRANGAEWLRLGVVEGNERAERFWRSQGFAQARIREGVELGNRTHRLRVMFKALGGGTKAQYLSLIARDRPEGSSDR